MAELCDLLVVGAGPHALTLCRYLQERGPRGVTIRVVDPEGWLQKWQRQLDSLGITMLRSHTTHHPDPDQYALVRFARGRSDDWIGRWSTPSVAVFADFCRSLLADRGLDQLLTHARVRRLAAVPGGVVAALDDGRQLLATRVALATNPGAPRLPAWAAEAARGAPPGRLVHTGELDLRGAGPLGGEHVVVVGGGLTAGHLALEALAGGARVTLVSRRPIVVRAFDVEGNWLAPPRLRGFFAERDMVRRAAMVEAARGGGSVTPPVAWGLRDARRVGTVKLREGCEVEAARWDGTAWELRLDGEIEWADRIWLATGTSLSVEDEPLLEGFSDLYPALVVGGLPALDRACRWPGTEIHLMGGLAALQTGPFARNLAGARMAAERILSCMAPLDRVDYLQPTA